MGNVYNIKEKLFLIGFLSCLVFLGSTHLTQQCGCPNRCQCNGDLTKIMCIKKGFVEIPLCLPKQVQYLSMHKNNLVSIDMSKMDTLPALEKLDLGNNKISKLQKGAFSNKVTPRLKVIYLNNNRINTIEEAAFDGLSTLNNITFQNNYITFMHPQAFTGKQIRLKTLNLDANYLQKIPPLENILEIETLSLNNNNISNATFPGVYKNKSTVNSIILSNNKIQRIYNHTFQSLSQTSVVQLKLTENGLHFIENYTFGPLTNLQSLYLGWNPLTAFDLEQGLQGLKGKRLKALNIANIQISGILPHSTFSLLQNVSLNSLVMSHNDIGTLHSSAFSQLQGLLLINLGSSKIKEISDNAFDGLPLLSTLSLESCYLASIPANLPKSLVTLYLNNNQFKTVPNKIFSNLTSLKQLYLGANQIRGLMSESFFGLNNLKILHLVDNKIDQLPGMMFEGMINLSSLQLKKNNIKHLPKTISPVFGTLSRLVFLDISHNELGLFPIDLFQKLTSLRTLKMDYNDLGQILARDFNGQIFKNLKELKFLSLSNNQIEQLSPNAFSSIDNILEINMKQNRISSWESSLFQRVKHLRTLDLSLNNIAVVNKSSVTYFKRGLSLNLTGNPFACNCDMRWFRDWINTTKTKLINVKKWKCNMPSSWQGKPFLSFDKTKVNCVFYTIYVVVGVSICAFLAALVIGFVIFKKRWFILLKFYNIRKKFREPNYHKAGYERIYGGDFKHIDNFDAYISCLDEDYLWAIENLLPGIDKGEYDKKSFGGDFCLYLEQRDATPGKGKMENMDEGLEQSQKAIVILSKDYIKSKYHEMELTEIIRMQRQKDLVDIKVVLIEGVTSKDIPKSLQRYVEQTNFLEWHNNDNVKEVFKEGIKNFLNSKKMGCRER